MIQADIPTYQTIVVKLLAQIDQLLNNFVFNGYSALSDYLKDPLGIISAIYIVIFGYSIMMGWVRVSMGNFMKATLKIGLIYLAVTQWSWLSHYFIGLINSAIGGIGDALIGASPVHIPGIAGMDGAMQLTLTEFTKVGLKVFDIGGLTNIGPLFDGIIILAFGYLIVGLGLFELILAKTMLAVLFVFTPLLVIFTYFKPFHSIFDRWLGAIVGFALLQLFVTAALTLALSLAYWWIGGHVGNTALQIGNYGTLPIVIIGIVCIGLTLKAANLAQNLGGVVSTSAASAMVGGMVGGAVGSAFSTLKAGGIALAPVRALRGLTSRSGSASGGVSNLKESSVSSTRMRDVQRTTRQGE